MVCLLGLVCFKKVSLVIFVIGVVFIIFVLYFLIGFLVFDFFVFRKVSVVFYLLLLFIFLFCKLIGGGKLKVLFVVYYNFNNVIIISDFLGNWENIFFFIFMVCFY